MKTSLTVLLFLAFFALLNQQSDAFFIQRSKQIREIHKSPTFLFCSSDSAAFEIQELRAQIKTLQKQHRGSNIRNFLDDEIQSQIQTYVSRVVEARTSHTSVARTLLGGKTWQLVYSTNPLDSDILPAGCTVFLSFLSEAALTYSLHFSANPVLQSIQVQSTWSCASDGTVTFRYNTATTSILGISNISVPFADFFLQGRATAIMTTYLDDTMWIEQTANAMGQVFSLYAPIQK